MLIKQSEEEEGKEVVDQERRERGRKTERKGRKAKREE